MPARFVSCDFLPILLSYNSLDMKAMRKLQIESAGKGEVHQTMGAMADIQYCAQLVRTENICCEREAYAGIVMRLPSGREQHKIIHYVRTFSASHNCRKCFGYFFVVVVDSS